MSKKPTQRFSFDPSEYDAGEDPGTTEYEETTADAVVDSLAGSTEDIDEQLEDVEERLELAAYYRVLLNNNPFNDNSPAATAVGAELKDFVKGRLRVLLGLRLENVPTATPTALPFDENEVRALKMLAAKVNGKPQLLEDKKAKAKEPSIRKVESPTPRAPAKVQPPKQPALKKTVIAPKQPAKPKQKDAIVEKDGKKYKRVVADGTWDDGTQETKEVLVDVTGQVRHPNALPMPTGMAMTITSAQKAAETLAASTEGNDDLINSAIALAQRS